MHFKNMRIGMRLGIGFGIMMVLSVSLRLWVSGAGIPSITVWETMSKKAT